MNQTILRKYQERFCFLSDDELDLELIRLTMFIIMNATKRSGQSFVIVEWFLRFPHNLLSPLVVRTLIQPLPSCPMRELHRRVSLANEKKPKALENGSF